MGAGSAGHWLHGHSGGSGCSCACLCFDDQGLGFDGLRSVG